ncbi:glucose dehydrogenase, partial [Trichonephila clavipes]
MKNHIATLGWVAYITVLISHQVTFICFRLWRRCSPEGALETMLKSNKPLNDSPVCKAMSFLGGLFEAHQVSVAWPSGKAIGGSTVINTMLYLRGNKHNYDDWANEGATGWSYEDVLPYFKKAEDNVNFEYVKN